MYLLLLEAFGAMVLLIFIVWWTMFSGRSKGELKVDPPEEAIKVDAVKIKPDTLLAPELETVLEPVLETELKAKVNPAPSKRA